MKLKLMLLIAFQALTLVCARGQNVQPLDARISAIANRPEFRHALFGIEIYSLTDDKVLYALNADKLFVPGSVTKILTEGTALQLLGADYRFHTRVYRTGPIAGGVLNGDLVLVAAGDPNLSNRVRSDDTLAFENEDHAYGHIEKAKLVAGDPLQVIRNLAKQVAAKGIKRINGRVLVDVGLFPEGTREAGSGVVISPISVNDNVIDVIIEPGKTPGSPTTIKVSPATKYATFQNEVTTAAEGSDPEIEFVSTTTGVGAWAVKVQGTIAAGDGPRPFPFVVTEPARFAEVVLAEALQQEGLEIVPGPSSKQVPDWKALAAFYSSENQIAEHTSPPFKEDVKVTLKVSQNLHAAMTPYLLGALLSNEHTDALQAGFRKERDFLQRMNLNPSAAAQSDGAGGNARFTPDFIVKFLAFMTKQKDSRSFHDALPILGRDGTLADTLRNSPAAGKLHAKTGTHVGGDLLNEQLVVNGKGLAGYLETKNGKQLIVAIFANNVPVGADLKAVFKVGDALAEIAAAAYDTP
ncbi:MAG TPA: D-alanyl-D-alanine carboxypeptidase/D-alanyl-D-alanine-endopeptidase [Pyrinomonadaceae bacterium]|nr:D-alanyl-D-alanine carboxypeptidase/D-alanyl-D-alanine-endopeptidase [Pyrinomonadaceae bacterium]